LLSDLRQNGSPLSRIRLIRNFSLMLTLRIRPLRRSRGLPQLINTRRLRTRNAKLRKLRMAAKNLILTLDVLYPRKGNTRELREAYLLVETLLEDLAPGMSTEELRRADFHAAHTSENLPGLRQLSQLVTGSNPFVVQIAVFLNHVGLFLRGVGLSREEIINDESSSLGKFVHVSAKVEELTADVLLVGVQICVDLKFVPVRDELHYGEKTVGVHVARVDDLMIRLPAAANILGTFDVADVNLTRRAACAVVGTFSTEKLVMVLARRRGLERMVDGVASGNVDDSRTTSVAASEVHDSYVAHFGDMW
jgi:hypothetical protein